MTAMKVTPPNVVFVSADLHGTLINQLTYRLLPGGSSQDSGAFEVITGAAAHDPPFGPSAFDYAGEVKITPALSLLQLLLNLAGVSSRETFNALPLVEKDRRFEGIMNLLLNAVGLDPLGFAGSTIEARWELGGPVVVHSYGWTEFEVDRNSHELVVSTHGLPAYTSAVERGAAFDNSVPQVLNRLRVRPRSVPPDFEARVQSVPDGLLISWRGAAVLESRSAIETNSVWQPAPEPVATDGVDSRVRVHATEQRRLFRVRSRNP